MFLTLLFVLAQAPAQHVRASAGVESVRMDGCPVATMSFAPGSSRPLTGWAEELRSMIEALVRAWTPTWTAQDHLVVTASANRADPASVGLAEARLRVVRQILIDSGVPEAWIRVDVWPDAQTRVPEEAADASVSISTEFPYVPPPPGPRIMC